MRNLTVDPDIAALIGQQRARDLEAGPYPALIRCRTCRREERVDAGVPVTAGVDVHPNGVRVWFLHRSCGRPQVVRVPHLVEPLEESISHAICYGGYGPDGPWACLLVEIAASLVTVHPAHHDADVDLALDVLAGCGMQPVADPLLPPAPEAITWRVQLPRTGGGGVYGRKPDGTRVALHEPLPPVPKGWLTLVAARGGRCGLYVASRAGLPGSAMHPDRELLAPLSAACRAGQVVATTAAVLT